MGSRQTAEDPTAGWGGTARALQAAAGQPRAQKDRKAPGNLALQPWCRRGGWGQLAEESPGPRGPVTSTCRAMALELGLAKHPSSWRLLLNLGSRGRVRGSADHFRGGAMPGNNGYIFIIGQNGLNGLGCSW